MKLLFTGDLLGDIELAANLIGGIEQRHPVAAAGCGSGKGQSGRPGSDHRQLFRLLRCHQRHLGLAAGTRVHQAGGEFAFKNLVEAGLVTTNAGIDFIGTPFGGFLHKSGVGQERARH